MIVEGHLGCGGSLLVVEGHLGCGGSVLVVDACTLSCEIIAHFVCAILVGLMLVVDACTLSCGIIAHFVCAILVGLMLVVGTWASWLCNPDTLGCRFLVILAVKSWLRDRSDRCVGVWAILAVESLQSRLWRHGTGAIIGTRAIIGTGAIVCTGPRSQWLENYGSAGY